MSTLLEKAKTAQAMCKRGGYSDEELALAIAYLKGEVRYGQVAIALNTKGKNLYAWLGPRMVEGYKRGLLNNEIKYYSQG